MSDLSVSSVHSERHGDGETARRRLIVSELCFPNLGTSPPLLNESHSPTALMRCFDCSVELKCDTHYCLDVAEASATLQNLRPSPTM